MSLRRPLSFWLVLATSLCADAAGVAWLATRNHTHWWPYYAVNVVGALTIGQLSVVAIWLAFRRRHDLWSWIVPLLALLGGAFVRLHLNVFSGFTVTDYACRSALQMLLSIVALWPLRRTVLWRWLSPYTDHPKWEFSLRQMLFLMTLTAVLSAFVARSTWADGQPVSLTQAIGIAAPPAVAVGVVVLSQLRVHWLPRIAGYLLVGAAVGTALAAFRQFDIVGALNVEFIIEALVIAAWVEWGGIVPRVCTVSAW